MKKKKQDMISFSIIFSTTSSAEDENTKKKKRAHAQTKKLTEYERNDSHNDPLQVGSSLYGFSPEIKLTMTLFFFFLYSSSFYARVIESLPTFMCMFDFSSKYKQ